jgi:hypothetical protein
VSKILGNRELIDSLTARASAGNLWGGYLFQGPKGVGKFSVAKDLARLALCLGMKDSSCTCRSCQNLSQHPDLVIAEPNAQGNILSSALEPAFQLFAEESSFGSPQKVFIVDGVESVHYSAHDELLKLLESLLEGDLVVMVSSQPEKVSDTYKSRLKGVTFLPLSRIECSEALKAQGFKGQWAKDLSRNASSLSLGLLSSPELYQGAYEYSLRLFKALRKMDFAKLMGLCENVRGDKHILALLELLHMRVVDAPASRQGSIKHVTFGSEKEEDLLTSEYDEAFSLPVADQLSSAIRDIRKGSPARPLLSQVMSACVAQTVSSVQHQKRLGEDAVD